MDVLLWPRMQSSLFDPRVYHQGILALVEDMLCALAFRGLCVWAYIFWASVSNVKRPALMRSSWVYPSTQSQTGSRRVI